MMFLSRPFAGVAAIVTLLISSLASAQVGITINEIRIDQPSTDNDEYFELTGPASTDLSGLTYLVIGDGAGGSGVIEAVVDLNGQSIPGSGFFVAAEATFTLASASMITSLNFENSDNVTHLLVSGFSGSNGDDLDTDDDGTLDATPWTGTVDCVALIETPGSGEQVYCATQVGPDGTFVPAHSFNCPAGWEIGAFDPAGGDDTPGTANPCEHPLVINEIMQNPSAVSDGNGEWFEIHNTGASAVDINGWTIADDGTNTHTVNNGGPLLVPAGGYLVLGINGDSVANGGVAVDYVYSDFFLANGDDEVVLLDGAMTEVDRVAYDGGPNFPDPTGASMALSDPALDNNVGANWCEASTPFGDGDSGTPGAPNDCSAAPLVCGEPATHIHDIQGTGDVSPMAGSEVEIEGIVTAVLQGPNEYGGLFVQEEDDDADADLMTSEGIFVFTNLPAAVADHVRVRGTVLEFNGLTELSPTTHVEICASGAFLPAPTPVTLPMTNSTEFEAVESMFVNLPQALYVTGNRDLWRFGELTVSHTRIQSPTQHAFPGAPANAAAQANARDQLIIDDRRTGSNLSPPILGQDDTNPFAANNPIRAGQLATGITGIMHYAFGAYRVQPTSPFVIDESTNPRTPAPAPVGGTLKVATFNVLNFFTTLDDSGSICGPAMNQGCRGADSATEYTRQLDKLVAAIAAINADVVGLQELENNASSSLQALVDASNAAVGAGTYAFIDTGTIGTDVIKVGFIYKPASVTPEGNFALLTSALDPRFDETRHRPALAQSFRATSNLALVTTVVNHLKSKGCSEASGADEDQGDGQGCFNAARTLAAEALRDWAHADPTGTGAENVLVLGDLNSYRREDPIQTLVAGGLTDLEHFFGGDASYSYVFSNEIGSVDYIMSTAALTPRVTGAVPWNINADEVVSLDYNTEFDVLPSFYAPTPYRSSDHDPIIVGLDMHPPKMITIPTLHPGVSAHLEIVGGGGACGISAAEFIDPNTLVPPPPSNLGFPYGVLRFTAERCIPGSTITMNVTFPVPLGFLAWFKHTLLGGWTPWQYQLAQSTYSFQVIDGGSGDQDGLANGTIIDPSGPAIVTTPRATFVVNKDFNDGNPAEVEVTIECTTGLPIMQSQSVAEGGSLEFIVGDFDVGELDCEVSEEPVEGYAAEHAASLGPFAVAGNVISSASSCRFLEVSNGQFNCDITNTLEQVRVTVDKIWIDDLAAENGAFLFAGAEWECEPVASLDNNVRGFNGSHDHGQLTFFGSNSGYRTAGDAPRLWDWDSFWIYPHFNGSVCDIVEREMDSDIFSDDSDCQNLEILPGYDLGVEVGTDVPVQSCVIINTRIYAGIPTLSEYGLALLALLMLGIGFVGFRRFA